MVVLGQRGRAQHTASGVQGVLRPASCAGTLGSPLQGLGRGGGTFPRMEPGVGCTVVAALRRVLITGRVQSGLLWAGGSGWGWGAWGAAPARDGHLGLCAQRGMALALGPGRGLPSPRGRSQRGFAQRQLLHGLRVSSTCRMGMWAAKRSPLPVHGSFPSSLDPGAWGAHLPSSPSGVGSVGVAGLVPGSGVVSSEPSG